MVDRVGDDAVTVLAVRGEHAVVSGEMGAGAWNEGGEAGDAKIGRIADLHSRRLPRRGVVHGCAA